MTIIMVMIMMVIYNDDSDDNDGDDIVTMMTIVVIVIYFSLQIIINKNEKTSTCNKTDIQHFNHVCAHLLLDSVLA